MACRGHSSTVLLVLLSFTLLFPFTPHAAAAPHPREAINRGAYWPTDTNFPPSSINSTYFTHVYYAFVHPVSSYKLKITSSDHQMLSTFAATLHSLKPPLKALLSMNGGDGPNVYGKLVSIPSARATFIGSTISVARKYGLDGLDLDWEFPADTVEMDNLGLLYTEWRAAIKKEAKKTGQPRLLLTSAVYFSSRFVIYGLPRSYPVKTMARTMDWVNVMCYDFTGSWNTTVTAAHAALYDPKSNVSTSYGINSWIDAGMPPEKIVMGLPLYGYTWKLKDPAVHGIGAPAVGVGPGEDGGLLYSELVDFIKANNATVVYDKTTVSEYAYQGTNWIGFDGPRSVTRKIEFARGINAVGYFFWALGYDKDWSISEIAYDAWANHRGGSS